MPNNDRVADLYYRRIHGVDAQDACRERIHWLATRVEGQDVLDVGCSQGVLTLLLAREGRNVTGLDIEAPAIEAAEQARAQESPDVQARVRLLVGDAFAAEFPPASFDTVVVGEILEHLALPEKLLARVRTWLRPGGRLLVSVPHGYEPFHDHKRTLYLLRLVTLLNQSFELLEVEPIHAQYLGAVGRRPRGDAPAAPVPAELLQAWQARCEGALETLQRLAHQAKVEAQAEARRLSERGNEYREHIDGLTRAGEGLRAEIRQAKTEADALRKREEFARTTLEAKWRERFTDVQQQLAESRKQCEGLTRTERDALLRATRLEAQEARLRELLADAQRQAQAAERGREALDTALKTARERATHFETALEAERHLRKDVQEQHRAQTARLQQLEESLRAAGEQRAAVEQELHAQQERIRQMEGLLSEKEACLNQLAAAREQAERVVTALKAEKRLRVDVQQQYRTLKQREKKIESLHEGEKQRRRYTEARVERLRDQLEYQKAELALLQRGVRFRIGDAFVRAAKPSLDTLKLPFRLLGLLLEGFGHVATRRKEASERRAAATPRAATARADAPACESAELPVLPGEPMSKENAAGVDPPASATPSAAPLLVRSADAVAVVPKSGTNGRALLEPPAPPATTAQPSDLDTIAALAQPFSSVPEALRRRNDLIVAAVTDEFSWRAWQFEADLYTFTPGDWQEALERRKPDVLFIESTWSGLKDSWYFQLRDYGQRHEVIKYYALPDLIGWCRERQIPTVFYNKEDPPNFDVFVEAARQFDHVFTSDANCIPDYHKHVEHEQVYSLPFAAQPRIHNPVMTGTRTGSVCFAGTWYAHRHLNRHEDAEVILRPALDFDLHIFDRMARSGSDNYRWPDIFLPALRGALPYAQMLTAYKRYRVFVNVNSVRNSPTMFSRRVFELLACGTPVISSYSEGIEELLGADVVLMSNDEATTRSLLEKVLGDDEYRERLSLRGQRQVFCHHTYTHRLQAVLNAIGLARPEVGRPVLTMLACIESADDVPAAWENYRRQDYANKRLLLCATDATIVAAAERIAGRDETVRVFVAEGALWGRALRGALRDCEQGYIAALNPRDYYGPHYLTDYANVTLYVPLPAFGKGTYYHAQNGATPAVARPGSEYRAASRVNGWTLCLPRDEAVQGAARLGGAQAPLEWWNRLTRQHDRLYSTDRFNYVMQGTGDADAPSTEATSSGFAASEEKEVAAALV